jgi:hypothetical protein
MNTCSICGRPKSNRNRCRHCENEKWRMNNPEAYEAARMHSNERRRGNRKDKVKKPANPENTRALHVLVTEPRSYIERILACRANDGSHRLIKQVMKEPPEAVQEMLL